MEEESDEEERDSSDEEKEKSREKEKKKSRKKEKEKEKEKKREERDGGGDGGGGGGGDSGPHRLTILSVNAKGLNKHEKIGDFLYWLTSSGADIVLLQEHKAANQDVVKEWMRGRSWEGTFSCEGTSKSGSAIIVKKSIAKQLKDIDFVNYQDGRCVSMIFRWGGVKTRIVSVYAPAAPSEREAYFDELAGKLQDDLPEEAELIIMGGDWNCVPSPELDRRGGNPGAGTIGITELNNITDDLDVEDIWRARNPEGFVTTWEGNNVACRLDRFYTSNNYEAWIEEVRHEECPYSDHRCVMLRVSPPEAVAIGKGTWSFNNSLLRHSRFCEVLRKVIAEELDQQSSESILDKWETFKFKAKRLARKFGTIQKEQQKKGKDKLSKEIESMEQRLKFHPSPQVRTAHKEARTALHTLLKGEVEGARTRSKQREVAFGSVPSKFFSQMENARAEKQIINVLEEGGIANTTTPTILESATQFYEELYSEVPDTKETRKSTDFIMNNIGSYLKDEDRRQLDRQIGLQDITEAVGRAGKGRSPGPDGLTAEFYSHFAKELAPYLLTVFKEIREQGTLLESMKDATIVLLFKKGARENVRNYRPISLLNVDLKILTKILSSRLSKVMSQLVGKGQTQVKGRYIQENVRTLLDLTYHFNATKGKGVVLLLDQEKAFDRLSWTYMKKVLETMGFGNEFRDWIDILYQDGRGQLKVNNTLGRKFAVKRGVRQGDPLSPLLYVLAIEGLAATIRKNKEITGVDIPGWTLNTLKVQMFADDTAIFLRNMSEIKEVRKVLKVFESASNAKVNWAKSVGLNYRLKIPPSEVWPGKWLADTDTEKYLGVPISLSLDIVKMWEKGIETVENSLKGWSRHITSLIGRKVIVNSYVLPKIHYLLQALPLPSAHRGTLEKRVFSFLWRGKKRGSVAREVCYLPLWQGGLGIQLIDDIDKKIKAKWILRLIEHDEIRWEKPWAAVAYPYLHNRAEPWGLGMDSLLCQLPRETRQLCPPFWRCAVEAWEKMRLVIDLKDLTDPERLNFPLWCNSVVKGADGKPFSGEGHQLLAEKGIIRVKDLISNNTLATDDELEEMFGIDNPDPVVWRVINSIPDALLSINEIGGGLTRTWEKLKIGGVPVARCKPKHFQRQLQLQRAGFPKSVVEWRERDIIVDWKRFWKVRVPGAWTQTGFLLRHRALMTGDMTRRIGWKAVDPNCKECGVAETLEHLFWDCPRAECIRDQWTNYADFIKADTITQRLVAHVVWAGRCEERIKDVPWCRVRTENRIAKEKEMMLSFQKVS